MTNEEILDDFRSKYKIPLADYRPLCAGFVEDMEGVTIWTDEGDVILYFPKQETKAGVTHTKEAKMTYLLEIKDVNDIIWYVRPKHIKHIQQRSKTTVIRLSEKARVKNNVIVLDKSAWEAIGPLRELQNRR